MTKKEKVVAKIQHENTEMKFAKLGLRMMKRIKEGTRFAPVVYEMYKDYYFGNMTLEEVGKKYNFSQKRTNEIIEKINTRLLAIVSASFDPSDKTNIKITSKYNALKLKYDKQQHFIKTFVELKKSINSIDFED